MKKYIFLIAAFAGFAMWSCSPGDENPPATPTIGLIAPADNADADLSAGNATSFAWKAVDGISDYTLVLSLAKNLGSPQTVAMDANPFSLSAAEFDAKAAALGIADGAEAKVYWSVRPTDASAKANSQVRSVNVTRGESGPATISLTAPADQAVIDLNDEAVTGVAFTWDKVTQVTEYNVLFSLSADLSGPVTEDAGEMGSLQFADKAAFDVLLGEVGLKAGETKTVYWSVVPKTENSAVVTQKRSMSATRIIVPLISPENGSWFLLDYEDKDEVAVTFEWTEHTGAASYELFVATEDDMSDASSIGSFATTSAPFKHSELQAMIENDDYDLKRYRPNTLYWNVKAGGDYLSDTPNEIELNGMRVLVDVRGTETNVYPVAVFNQTDHGYSAIWLAEDLRAEYDNATPAVAFNSRQNGGTPVEIGFVPDRVGAYGNEDGAAVPQYVKDNAGVYYDMTKPLHDRLAPAGWELPSVKEVEDLFKAAELATGGIFVLKKAECYPGNEPGYDNYVDFNKWGMNMYTNGNWAWNLWTFQLDASTWCATSEGDMAVFTYGYGPAVISKTNTTGVCVRLVYPGDDE